MTKCLTETYVGVGGWTYEPWRGVFYPKGLPQARELDYAGTHLTSIEINGTFYRTQVPATFRKWAAEVPDGFVFALKGPRYAVNRRVLAEAGIGIHTLTLADTQQFGLLRLIVTDWEKGRAILEQAGYLVNVTEVVAVEVADRPGGLAGLLDLFEGSGINIEYMYAFTFGREDKAVLIFRFDQPDAAIERLRAAGINVVEDVELYHRIHV